MTGELLSRAVFLDTCQFVRRKFDYKNKELASFRDLCRDGLLQLVLTDVTTRELEAKLEEQLGEATKALKDLRKNAVALQSLDEDWLGEVLFRRPEKEKLLAGLKERLHGYLEEAECETVPTEGLPAGPVLDRYFEGRPPFGSGDKKHEFPDAFALAALESWCERTRRKVHVVSDDGDLKAACEGSPSLVYAGHLAGILERALKAKGLRPEVAHSIFDERRGELEEAIRKTLEDTDVLFLDEAGAEVLKVKVDTIDFGPETVIGQVDGLADLSLHADVSFEADVEYYEPGNFIWDDETRTPIYFEKTRRRIERTVEVPVEVTIRFDPADPQSSAIEQFAVNRNEGLIVETED